METSAVFSSDQRGLPDCKELGTKLKALQEDRSEGSINHVRRSQLVIWMPRSLELRCGLLSALTASRDTKTPCGPIHYLCSALRLVILSNPVQLSAALGRRHAHGARMMAAQDLYLSPPHAHPVKI